MDEPSRHLQSQQAALERAAALALAYLQSLDSRPAGATATLAELRERLALPLSDAGVDAES